MLDFLARDVSAPIVNDPNPFRPAPPSTGRIEQWIALAVLVVLVAGCYLVLQPFLTAVLWAIVLCCTTWPVFTRLRSAMRGRITVPALLLTLAVALVLLAPFVIVGISLAENANQLLEQGKRIIDEGPPDPPAWVARIPLVGEHARAYWAGIAHDSAGFLADLKQYLQPLQAFALAGAASLAYGVLQLALSVLIVFFLYRDGEAMSQRLSASVGRIAGERGGRLIAVAVATTRGVVYGILGTAIAQGVLAAVGFWLAGVPAAPLLGLATFFLSPVPVGPPLVWAPAAFWLFAHDHAGWGIFMLIWGVAVVSSVDNFIKPLIISYGSDLPFILVLLGVLGGVIAFGFIGVFLGPTLLAIGFALIQDWSEEKRRIATS
ncbi:MAG TPA: AI-2E family transporter [Casimicrobiaceae bacterium]|nr:AI-2E family transporter [Casimicrobiaceae bacterium]